MALRPPQSATLAAVKSEYEAGIRRQVASLATGVGKTVIFSNLYDYMGFTGTMFVLAHRDELIKQAVEKLQFWNPRLKIGIEMGQDYYADVDCDVVVASVATLGREGSQRIQRFNKSNVAAVVVDECHHSVSTTYINIFNHFGCFDETSNILLLGVTATTGRGDGQGLSKVYQKVVYQYSMRQAIEDGYLCDVRAFRLKTDTDISRVKTKSGDFAVGELSNAVNTPKRNQQVVKCWLQKAKDRQTIAFTADIQHAKDLAAMFNHHGIKAEAVWGDDPQREWKLARHKGPAAMEAYCIKHELPVPSPEALEDLRLQVLCNCGVLTEGYDDWQVSCVIMARPTKSQTLFVQCIGRGTRLQDGVDNLKRALKEGWALSKIDCLVIDVVDSTSRMSLVTVPSIFGMSAEIDLLGDSALKSLKKLEAAQAQYPDVDFSELEHIDQIEATVEAANIWEVKFPEEIENATNLSWNRSFDGAYVITLPSKVKDRPSKDSIKIKQNVLDKWEISATIDGQAYAGIRDTIEEAFVAGDTLLITKAADAIKILKREAEWHDEEITPPQVRLLTRLLKKRKGGGSREIPAGFTKGQANKLISKLLAEKVTGKVAA